MPGTQELTRRIKSVKSTRKVTRAMQMVSASKMRKSQGSALSSRTYADLAWELLRSLEGQETQSSDEAMSHAGLLRAYHHARKIMVLVVSTNRGLAGGFNTNLMSKLKDIEQQHAGLGIELITIGKKATEGSARSGKQVVADFTKPEGVIEVEGVYPIASYVAALYGTGEYRHVCVVYNHFVSTLIQRPTVKWLLPLAQVSGASQRLPTPVEYQMEPDQHTVMEHLLPRILESQLYQALLESDASEHSARMIMMKNATDSAADLIADLTLTFNQLRQNKITTELSEITAGKIALEKTN